MHSATGRHLSATLPFGLCFGLLFIILYKTLCGAAATAAAFLSEPGCSEEGIVEDDEEETEAEAKGEGG